MSVSTYEYENIKFWCVALLNISVILALYKSLITFIIRPFSGTLKILFFFPQNTTNAMANLN